MQGSKERVQKTDSKPERVIRERRIPYSVCATGFGIIVLLAALLLFVRSTQSMQSSPAFPVPVRLVGEYSLDNEAWQPLTENTKFNALDGDLYLRGQFDSSFNPSTVYAYLDHISADVFYGDQQVYGDTGDILTSSNSYECTNWDAWNASSVSINELKIHLSNPHSLGNPRAYNDFLDNLYSANFSGLSYFVLHPASFLNSGIVSPFDYLASGQFWRVIGFTMLLLSLLIFGVASADSLQNKTFGMLLWGMGALALLSGGMIVLDTPDVYLWLRRYEFITYGAQLCRMLWAVVLSFCVAGLVSDRRKQFASIAAAANGVFTGALILVSLLGGTHICRLVTPWAEGQAVFCLLMLTFCMLEIFKFSVQKNKWLLRSMLLSLITAAAELGNARFGLWQRGLVLNSVSTIMFVICLVWLIKTIPQTYRAAKRAAEQENELTESRISIMLSQIQPHFLYNSLNSIGHLCEKDPPTAKTAVDDFAAYLRGNLDSVKRTKPVPFEKELEHVRIYLSLEKIRFDEELNIVWNTQATGFLIPALTVQPLVENAVKYGVGKKVGGGTVTISSAEYPDRFEVAVSDDGVGYDPSVVQDDGRSHIGIDNVRSRLASMMGGRLNITSQQGAGTTATIIIPKEDMRHADHRG